MEDWMVSTLGLKGSDYNFRSKSPKLDPGKVQPWICRSFVGVMKIDFNRLKIVIY